MYTASNANVVELIQLSLVPVFLLVGIGQILNVVTGRLARIIDRARWFECEKEIGNIKQYNHNQSRELNALRRRMRFANWAINLLTTAAVLVCMTVAVLLFNGIVNTVLDSLVLLLFILALAFIIGGLIGFLIEVSIASATLTIPQIKD